MNKKTFTILGATALLFTSCNWFNPTPASNKTLESIALSDYTTTYALNSTFSFDGVVTAHYSDNSSKVVTPTNVSTPNMSTLGEKDVTVTYTEKSVTKFASYTINVTNDPAPGPSGEAIDLTKFNQLKNYILTNHNYTARIEGKFEDEEDLFADYSLYNINDEVIYTDNSEYFNYGYIKQKNQGVVEFYQNKESGAIIPGDFVCTNTQRTMSELYVLALEGVLDVTFSADEANKNYSASGRDSIAIMGNLALGDYIIWASASEGNKFTAVTQDNFTKLILSARFIYNYQSTESGSLDDTFKQVPFDVVITISNVGSTTNSYLESYVSNPSYVYPNPTKWDEYDEEILKQHFGDSVPPFIDGLTYSYKCSETLVSGKYYGIVEDYASGDLSTSYGNYLKNNGYTKGEDGKYSKVLKDDDRKIESTWTISFNYLSPTDEDEYGMKYGYLYPNGVFTALFRYTERTTEEIETVAQLNDYIARTDAGGFLPEFPTTFGITKVSGFKDGTAAAEAVDGADFALVSPTSGGYFKLYIADYDIACSFIRAYGALLETRGLETQGIGHFAFTAWVDDYFSKVTFGDIEWAKAQGTTSNPYVYPGYVDIQISIYQASVDNYDPKPTEKVLSSISVSGQKTTFNLNEDFVFNGTCTAHYSDTTSQAVTPTSVSEPDMTTPGEKEIVVSYTENGVTKTTGYLIEVIDPSDVKYNIILQQPSGATISVTYPSSDKTKQKPGESVTFKVQATSGYTVNSVSVMAGTTPVAVSSNPMVPGTYSFIMPESDVVISANVTKDGGDPSTEFGGEYVFTKTMTNPEYYNRYTFTFNDDGTGTYVRTRYNLEGLRVIATLSFTYTKSGNKVTITKVTFVDCDSTDFESGYRVFHDDSMTVNPTGVDNGDGTFTIDLGDTNGNYSPVTFGR